MNLAAWLPKSKRPARKHGVTSCWISGGPIRGSGQIFQALSRGMRGRQTIENQAGIADNAGEEIVKIVRDAAGQDAQAFEALRLAELRFQLSSLGNVSRYMGSARNGAGHIANRRNAQRYFDKLPAFP